MRAGLNRMTSVEVEGDMMNVAMGGAGLEGVERVVMISLHARKGGSRCHEE